MPTRVCAIEPEELSPTRVAWTEENFVSGEKHRACLSIEGHKLKIELDDHAAEFFIHTVADALFKLIAPHTSHWEAMAEQGCKGLECSLADRLERGAREVAQSEAARKFRQGELEEEDIADFEERRFNELKVALVDKLAAPGELAELPTLPSIRELNND